MLLILLFRVKQVDLVTGRVFLFSKGIVAVLQGMFTASWSLVIKVRLLRLPGNTITAGVLNCFRTNHVYMCLHIIYIFKIDNDIA